MKKMSAELSDLQKDGLISQDVNGNIVLTEGCQVLTESKKNIKEREDFYKKLRESLKTKEK